MPVKSLVLNTKKSHKNIEQHAQMANIMMPMLERPRFFLIHEEM